MKFKSVKSLTLMMFGVLLLSSCGGKKTTPLITEQQEKADIEVIYFYGSQRCATCKAMEKFAQEAVNNKPEYPEKVDLTAFGFRNARNNRDVYKLLPFRF